MRVWIRGEGAIELSRQDFVGQGGQASIYARGDVALKIYDDPGRVISEGKLRELSALAHPSVIGPQKVVCDENGRPLGYTMRHVRDAFAICQLFPRSFRERNGVTAQTVLHLVERLRDGVRHIHEAGVLIVDLNEMNLLVDRTFDELYFIDVDSYQTRSHPADAINESIRDRHAPTGGFSRSTDWFSFAVVSFQLFVGIHPFKGTHPTVRGLDARMRANLSVLNPAVRVPTTVYPWSIIPPPMLRWYEAVFEKGSRLPPPETTGAVFFTPSVQTVSGRGVLRVREIGSFDGQVTRVWARDGRLVVATTNGIWLDGRRVGDGAGRREVAFAPMGQPISVTASGSGVDLTNLLDNRAIPIELNASEVAGYDGRVHVRSHDKIVELVLVEAGGRLVASSRVVANVLPRATRLFSGVAIQNLLGASYVSVFPKAGSACQSHLKELDAYWILDARFDSGVLMVLGRTRQKSHDRFDRLIFRFSDDHTYYDVRLIEDVVPTGLSFVVLDTGVCVSVTEEEKLELFHARVGSVGVKVIADDFVRGDVALARRPGQLLVARGAALYSMTMP